MSWSWRIGRISGIGIYVHFTFLLLLAWAAMRSWPQFIITLCLFGFVVLHELGHALTARRFGIQTRDITLFFIGGIARLSRIPEDPRQELLVALAGPAVNAVIATLFFVVLLPTRSSALPGASGHGLSQFVANLMWVNVALALFNLLPAFPMDGGRVLRALLALQMDYLKATEVAAGIGQMMALLFGLAGLFYNPLLIFIALVVWIGAAGEAAMVQMKVALGGIPLSRAMITDYRVLTPHQTLDEAVAHVLHGFQEDFPVVENDRVVGVLTRRDLLTALARENQGAEVGDTMQTRFQLAAPSDMLEGVLSHIRDDECCRTIPVVENGHLVGLVTLENLGEFLMVQEALSDNRAPRYPSSTPG